MKGIFISKGITPIIKKGDLIITQNESNEPDVQITLSLQYDSCPTWIKLSIDHLKQAKKWRANRNKAFKGTDYESESLEREFEHSMQAIISMAIAYDSFYATIKKKIDLPKDLTEKWAVNRTSRKIQISETIRRAFKINKAGTQILKQSIKEILHYRDLAVHPNSNIEKPVMHPELSIGVEWRFATFTYNNAKIIVNEGLKRIREILLIKTPHNLELENYCISLLTLIKPIIEIYENEIEQIK